PALGLPEGPHKLEGVLARREREGLQRLVEVVVLDRFGGVVPLVVVHEYRDRPLHTGSPWRGHLFSVSGLKTLIHGKPPLGGESRCHATGSPSLGNNVSSLRNGFHFSVVADHGRTRARERLSRHSWGCRQLAPIAFR